MSLNSYLTVQSPGEATLIIKKSKFISNVSSVESQNDADAFIYDLKKKYWNATHNVYAYSIGVDEGIQKFSDDGEPSGTAGKPVLEAIKTMGIRNVAVVVTRYFGGILLGAGGLVRAYGDSAALGLRQAKIIKKIKCDKYEVECGYSVFNKLEWEIRQRPIIIQDTEFTDTVKLKICVPLDFRQDFTQYILDLTSGEASVRWVSNLYVDDDHC